ncbi:MAG TPA: GyrI-like domain-containing protein [Steroidobacteraceae bacterium]|nr:GyrI-like domain-containing protein [Steroidobacteraceae bacterium]
MSATSPLDPQGCRIVNAERRIAAVINALVPLDSIPQAERAMRKQLGVVVPTLGVGPAGLSFTLWRPPAEGKFEMAPGMIVAREFKPVGDVVCSGLPAGRAAYYLLEAPYDTLPAAWQMLFDWCKAGEHELANLNWQLYEDPGDDTRPPRTSLYALLA